MPGKRALGSTAISHHDSLESAIITVMNCFGVLITSRAAEGRSQIYTAAPTAFISLRHVKEERHHIEVLGVLH